MSEFIKRNRRLLKFYFIVAQILGWLLMAGGVFWFILTFSSSSLDIYNNDRPDVLLYGISSMLFDFMLPGLIALGVTQLIRYLFEDTSKPGFILRNADRIFYMYAVFLIMKTYLKYFWYSAWYAQLIKSEASRLLFMQPFLLPTVAKILILIGLGQILRRLMPVIEESKTLV